MLFHISKVVVLRGLVEIQKKGNDFFKNEFKIIELFK